MGGLLAGGAAGSVLSGGFNDLLKQFQQGGQGDIVQSWIGTGPNKSISSDVLSKVLSPDQIRTLSAQSGMSHDDLIATLSQQLPEMVNQLTPDGSIPTECEASRLIGNLAPIYNGSLTWASCRSFSSASSRGLIARFLVPGPNNPSGFILTVALASHDFFEQKNSFSLDSIDFLQFARRGVRPTSSNSN